MQGPWLRIVAGVGGAGLVGSLAAGLPGTAAPRTANADTVDCARVDDPTGGRQGDFAQAADAAGVPTSILLSVSYLESRWDDHDGTPSTSGGYGPMHLTSVSIDHLDGRGVGAANRPPLQSLQTARLASDLTGVATDRLRTDPAANICGGAAVLARYQDLAGGPGGTASDPASWTDAVARYAGANDAADSGRFVRQVYAVLRSGAARTTNDGERVRLAAQPGVSPQVSTRAVADDPAVDCPPSLGCEWLPAPYEWYGAPDPGAYGNHDLADRPNDLSIDYIIVHDTETDWQTTLDLVTDPTYLSWQYTLRSSDGHIWQHLEPRDVGWQAGNWYVNSHSIGLEHEGIAAEGATWFTEAMYQTSAALVRHLTDKYDIPRDRAHIIGHDQVPSILPANVAGMHWDPGPYWDWEHYMRLLHSPIPVRPGRIHVGDTLTVRPGFADNQPPVSGCVRPRDPCERQGANFVYLRTEPRPGAPLVNDAGLHPDGAPGTRQVWDISARAAAGHEFVVAKRRGAWIGVWYLGEIAWLRSPAGDPTVFKTRGGRMHVVPTADEVPVYGRPYPEPGAYPPDVPVQPIVPLQYTFKAGQEYVVADHEVPTNYYRATTFDGSSPGDWTVISGDITYYQIWFGHRFFYVQADDVELVEP